MRRNCGIGPLLLVGRTEAGSSSSKNDPVRTLRAARCVTMPRQECAKPLIKKPGSFTMKKQGSFLKKSAEPGSFSIKKQGSFSKKSAAENKPQKHSPLEKTSDRVPSISFSREPSITTRSKAKAGSMLGSMSKQRQQRRPSDTTDATNMPSMIHTSSMEVQTQQRRPSLRRASSMEMLGDEFTRTLSTNTQSCTDFQALNDQGSETLDPRLFDPRSAQFLFQDIEV